jgi:hypothetical protein
MCNDAASLDPFETGAVNVKQFGGVRFTVLFAIE